MAPPVTSASGKWRVAPPSRTPICSLRGSYSSAVATSGLALPPNTSACPPPMNRLNEPSLAATELICICSLSSRSIWSRWSSRSLGAWPDPCAPAICVFRSAKRVASALTLATVACRSWLTPPCSASSCPPALRKRAAISSARANTTWRAALSCGWLATSTKAFRNSLAAWPMPVSPSGNTFSSSCNWVERVASALACERDSPASRARKSLCERLTVRTSTPLPK